MHITSLRLLLATIFALGLMMPIELHAASTDSMETFFKDYSNNEIDSLTKSELDEIVVTATRTPKALKDVPVVTRVLNAEDIKKTDATNIKDLLSEEMPGIEFGYSMAQETSLNLNGYAGSSILFLVDGERLAGETLDNVDYSRLGLDNIGRVEIVKGAASSLYGANAVGGVVNLISKENTRPWHVNLNSRYNSFGKEWRNGANVSFNKGKWNSATSLQYVKSEKVQLISNFDVASVIHQVYGGQNLNLKERLSFRANGNLRFIARGGYFQRISNRSTYDDHYNDYNGGLRSEWQMTDHSNLEISYSYDQYDKSRYINGKRTHDHDYSNRQHIAHGLYNHFFGVNCLTVGADYLYDYLTTYQFAGKGWHNQTNIDAFVQFDYSPLEWLNLVGGVREDYFSESNRNAVTGRVALMFKPAPLTIRASYAGGFRAPSLKEMYMDFDMAGIFIIHGNPDLKPEKSQNFNLSLERNANVHHGILAGSYSVALTGYYNYYTSRIILSTDDITDSLEDPNIYYENDKDVKVTGFDFTGRYRFISGIEAFGSINWMHMSGQIIESPFLRPRPFSATWRLGYDKRINKNYQFYVSISGRYMSKPQSKYSTDDSYSLWKFTFQQNIWKGIDLNFTVDNLFNYKPKTFYWNSPITTGTSWTLGVSLDIDNFF